MKTQIILAVIVLSLLWSGSLFGQLEVQWMKTYGGDGEDECRDIVQTADGGYLLAGFAGGPQNGACLVRTDTSGDTLWTRRYGGYEFFAVVRAEDGGFVATGSNGSLWVIKVDENGETLWETNYGVGVEGLPSWNFSLTNGAEGEYVVATGTYEYEEGGGYLLTWLNDQGGIIQQKWYHIGAGDCAYSVCKTTGFNGFAVGGISRDLEGNRHQTLVRVDEFGDSLWTIKCRLSPSSSFSQVIETCDHGFALAGNGPGQQFCLIRLAENGDSLWSFRSDRERENECRSVVETGNGELIQAGYAWMFERASDMMLIRTNAQGDSVGGLILDLPGWQDCNKIIRTSDGGYALAGYTGRLGTRDFFLVKLGPDSANLGIKQTTPFTPSSLFLSAYPNPFNGQVTLNYNLQQMGLVEISVFDALGRQVAKMQQGYQLPGTHKLNWDAGGLPSGEYQVVLSQKGEQAVKSVVLTK